MGRIESVVREIEQCATQYGCGRCHEHERCAYKELIPPQARAGIAKRKTATYLERGDMLFRTGEIPFGFWVVCKGQLKVSRLAADGKPLILHVAQAGDTVGATAFFSRKAYEGSAVALEPTLVTFLQTAVVEDLIAFNSEFAVSMLKKLASEVSSAESKAVNMAYRSARDRVIGVLQDIHLHDKEHGSDGWSFTLPRRELAEQAGLTVETIVRVLKCLEKEGLLFLEGRRIEVKNRPLFSALMLAEG